MARVKCSHCGHEAEVSYDAITFDRTGVEDVAVICADGTKITYLEMIEKRDFYRRDMVLVNRVVDGVYKEQYAIEPYVDVYLLETQEGWKFLTPTQKRWCKSQIKRLLETEKRYGIAGKLTY